MGRVTKTDHVHTLLNGVHKCTALHSHFILRQPPLARLATCPPPPIRA
jgi:hypothetical protein